MKVILASNNKHKRDEFVQIFSAQKINLELLMPNDLYLSGLDIDETGSTFEENALIKAKEFYQAAGMPAIADDSGLEVDILNHKPGVHSARYAGINASDSDNRKKLISELSKYDFSEHKARFKCVICYYDGDLTIFGKGTVEGKIISKELGDGGFGYDPLFIPNGYNHTFAQMDSELKNSISHRKNAIMDFISKFQFI